MRFIRLLLLQLIFINFLLAQDFIQGPNLSVNRYLGSSEQLPNGNILVFGGNNGNIYSVYQFPISYNSTEEYDVEQKTWITRPNLNFDRYNFSSVVLNDGKILVSGGESNSVSDVKECEVYDYTSNSWIQVGSLNAGRYGHSSVKLKDGRVLVAGGLSGTLNLYSEIYNPLNNTWSVSGKMNLFHNQGMVLTLLSNGKVLATGGKTNGNSAEIFDPVTQQWTLLPNLMLYKRSYHSVIEIDSVHYLFVGMGDGALSNNQYKYSEVFNLNTSTFTSTGALPYSIFYSPGIIKDENGDVITYSGFNSLDNATPQYVQKYIAATNTWQSIPNFNFEGMDYSKIYKLPDGEYLFLGGENIYDTLSGSNFCYYMYPDNFNTCLNSSDSLIFDSDSICYGKNLNLTIGNSVLNREYQFYIGDKPVGNKIIGNINQFIIAENELAVGENLIHYQYKDNGCPYKFNNNYKSVIVIQNLETPLLYAKNENALCAGELTNVYSNINNASIYNWNIAGNNDTLFDVSPGIYCLQYCDSNGCKSSISNPLQIEQFTPSMLNAGADITLCSDINGAQLTGFSPSGGYWLGTNIDSGGYFLCNGLPNGQYTAIYNYCNFSDTVKIKTTTPPSFNERTILRYPGCNNGFTDLEINSSEYAKYNFSLDSSYFLSFGS